MPIYLLFIRVLPSVEFCFTLKTYLKGAPFYNASSLLPYPPTSTKVDILPQPKLLQTRPREKRALEDSTTCARQFRAFPQCSGRNIVRTNAYSLISIPSAAARTLG